MSNIIVAGATNQIGHFLLLRLQKAIAISRQTYPNTDNITWLKIDLKTEILPLETPSKLFYSAPLPLLPPLLERLPKTTLLKRVIVLSSTSCFTKENSTDFNEQAIANQLIQAELALIKECQQRNIAWTILRPTLVYGCGLDKNITFIANFIRRFGFFPIVGQGSGLRQPVHADDLAKACIQVASSENTINKTYNLTGGQTLSYRDMVITIFKFLGKKPHIISISPSLFKAIISCISWLPKYSHLSTAMVTRINQDLCFDHTAAQHDFDYQPRKFMDLGL
ncbi:NAD-dependent epimerase/dehydratase family protein [Candidatus Halobeggiatoa sp. HSG11]|nr:NAD-dependent epimerase/dehydratase family protein [Candidatus Halobeggiatoa sp. HSG11]